MCWSALASFTTLGIGTVLNILSYAALRRWKSPTSSLVWSWQYALLMQIPEGIVWMHLDRGEENAPVTMSRLAMALNVTQPVALLLGIRLGGLYREFRYAYVVVFMYLVVLLTQIDEIWSASASIAPEEGCPHLSLRYWDASRGIVYVVSSLLVVSEARPLYWAFANAALFSVTFLLAIVVYPCGVGSVWCWFVFVTGPSLVAFDRLRTRCVREDRSVVTPSSSFARDRSLFSHRSSGVI